jgi:hypothetical protein
LDLSNAFEEFIRNFGSSNKHFNENWQEKSIFIPIEAKHDNSMNFLNEMKCPPKENLANDETGRK